MALSRKGRIEVFHLATKSLLRRYGDRFKSGMSDEELRSALETCLGIFGGSGGPDRLSVAYRGSGLKIWGGWRVINHVTDKPLYSGKATIAMAREVYGIGNPEDAQMSLL